MKRLAVILSREVREQIDAQVLFIADDSIDNALKWERPLFKAIEKLGDAPGHVVDEDASDRLGFIVRKLVFERTYLIHYTVDRSAGDVRVINFRHGARLPRQDEP